MEKIKLNTYVFSPFIGKIKGHGHSPRIKKCIWSWADTLHFSSSIYPQLLTHTAISSSYKYNGIVVTKSFMYKVLKQHSIVTDMDLSKHSVGKDLGQFKLEYKIKEVYFVSNKTYCLILDNNESIIKSKGVLSSSLTVQDFKDIYCNKLNIKATKGDTKTDYFKGSVTIATKKAILNHDAYTKREKIYNDFGLGVDTKPLIRVDETSLVKYKNNFSLIIYVDPLKKDKQITNIILPKVIIKSDGRSQPTANKVVSKIYSLFVCFVTYITTKLNNWWSKMDLTEKLKNFIIKRIRIYGIREFIIPLITPYINNRITPFYDKHIIPNIIYLFETIIPYFSLYTENIISIMSPIMEYIPLFSIMVFFMGIKSIFKIYFNIKLINPYLYIKKTVSGFTLVSYCPALLMTHEDDQIKKKFKDSFLPFNSENDDQIIERLSTGNVKFNTVTLNRPLIDIINNNNQWNNRLKNDLIDCLSKKPIIQDINRNEIDNKLYECWSTLMNKHEMLEGKRSILSILVKPKYVPNSRWNKSINGRDRTLSNSIFDSIIEYNDLYKRIKRLEDELIRRRSNLSSILNPVD